MFKWPVVLVVVLSAYGCRKQGSGQEPAEGDDQARLQVEPFNRASVSTAPEEIYVAIKGPLAYTKPVLEVLTLAELRSEKTGEIWTLQADGSYAQVPEVYSAAEGYPLHLRVPSIPEGDYAVRLRFRSWGYKLHDDNPAETFVRDADGVEFVYRFSISSKSFFVETVGHCQTKFSIHFSEPGGALADRLDTELQVTADGRAVSCTVDEQYRESNGMVGDPLMVDCDAQLKSPLEITFPPNLFFSAENHKFLASHSDPATALTALKGASDTPVETCVAIDRP